MVDRDLQTKNCIDVKSMEPVYSKKKKKLALAVLGCYAVVVIIVLVRSYLKEKHRRSADRPYMFNV